MESVIQKSQFAWTNHLRIYNVHPPRSESWSIAEAAIADDDDGALCRLFELRTLTPFDADYCRRSLLCVSELLSYRIVPLRIRPNPQEQLAMERSAWKVCHYLLDLGVSYLAGVLGILRCQEPDGDDKLRRPMPFPLLRRGVLLWSL